ncbi:LamG domain-containing protein [bacterium]|nr:LamG domain-containing protein [bacterium]
MKTQFSTLFLFCTALALTACAVRRTNSEQPVQQSTTTDVCAASLNATLSRTNADDEVLADNAVEWTVTATGCTKYMLMNAPTSSPFTSSLKYSRGYAAGSQRESVVVLGFNAVGNLAASKPLMSNPFTVLDPSSFNIALDMTVDGASSKTIEYGQSTSLNWSVTGASSCVLTPGNVNATSLNSYSTGSLSATTTYSMACTNARGNTATDSVTITVRPQVTAWIRANGANPPAAITEGETVTLTWGSSGSSSCAMSPVVPGIVIADGHGWAFPAEASVTYTLTCTNGVSSASDFVTVNKNSRPAASIYANGLKSTTVNYGMFPTLTWSSQYASLCRVNEYNLGLSSTNALLEPLYATKTYNLACSDSMGQSASDQVTVAVNQATARNVSMSGALALLHFDETSGAAGITNSLGSGNAAAAAESSTPAPTTSGWFAGAGVFNNSALSLGTRPAILGTADFTIAFWIRTTSTSDQRLVQQRDYNEFNGQYMLTLTAAGGILYQDYFDGKFYLSFGSAKAVNDSRWHHVAFVRTATGGKIYIDGVLDNEQVKAVAPLRMATVFIGYDGRHILNYAQSYPKVFFQGALDEFLLFNRALSAAEITALVPQPK